MLRYALLNLEIIFSFKLKFFIRIYKNTNSYKHLQSKYQFLSSVYINVLIYVCNNIFIMLQITIFSRTIICMFTRRNNYEKKFILFESYLDSNQKIDKFSSRMKCLLEHVFLCICRIKHHSTAINFTQNFLNTPKLITFEAFQYNFKKFIIECNEVSLKCDRKSAQMIN